MAFSSNPRAFSFKNIKLLIFFGFFWLIKYLDDPKLNEMSSINVVLQTAPRRWIYYSPGVKDEKLGIGKERILDWFVDQDHQHSTKLLLPERGEYKITLFIAFPKGGDGQDPTFHVRGPLPTFTKTQITEHYVKAEFAVARLYEGDEGLDFLVYCYAASKNITHSYQDAVVIYELLA